MEISEGEVTTFTMTESELSMLLDMMHNWGYHSGFQAADPNLYCAVVSTSDFETAQAKDYEIFEQNHGIATFTEHLVDVNSL